MPELIRRAVHVTLPRLEAVTSVATAAAFFWLLFEGLVPPLAVYALEIFLSF